MTQYIGKLKLTSNTSPKRDNDDTSSQDKLKLELSKLKKNYLQKAEMLVRATVHLEALDNAVDKDRISTKLKINVRPMVINKDNAKFQQEWHWAI